MYKRTGESRRQNESDRRRREDVFAKCPKHAVLRWLRTTNDDSLEWGDKSSQ
jgi:hypothetical protein